MSNEDRGGSRPVPDSNPAPRRARTEGGPSGEDPSTEGRSPWTPLTLVGWILTAVGFGVYIPFASEEADAQNAGQSVSGGIRAGVLIGGVVFLMGLATLLAEGVRRGAREGRLLAKVGQQLGLGLLAILAGFAVMYIVVHIAFD